MSLTYAVFFTRQLISTTMTVSQLGSVRLPGGGAIPNIGLGE